MSSVRSFLWEGRGALYVEPVYIIPRLRQDDLAIYHPVYEMLQCSYLAALATIDKSM